MPKPKKPSFEESLDIINEELIKRRARWMLSSIPYVDYDDVCQIIRFHIYVKWSLYDPAQPLRNWVSRVITNQTRNLVRNLYSNNAPVCHRCPANQGGGLCAFFGTTQSPQCKVFTSWQERKQEAFNIKLPLALENHIDQVHEIPAETFNLEATAESLHLRMQEVLTEQEWEVYQILFIDQKTDEEAAKIMGYRTSEKFRVAGYRTLANIRKSIMEKVKTAIYGDDAIDLVK